MTSVFKYLKILTVGRFEINYLQAQKSKIKCLNTKLKVLWVLTWYKLSCQLSSVVTLSSVVSWGCFTLFAVHQIVFVSGRIWMYLCALCPVSVAAMKEREITGGKGKGLNKWKRGKIEFIRSGVSLKNQLLYAVKYTCQCKYFQRAQYKELHNSQKLDILRLVFWWYYYWGLTFLKGVPFNEADLYWCSSCSRESLLKIVKGWSLTSEKSYFAK